MEMEFETTTVFQEEIQQEEIQELEEIQEPEQVQEPEQEQAEIIETIVEDVAEVTEVTEVGEVTTSETEETTVTTTKVIDYTPLLTSINNNIVDTNLFLFLITVTMFIVILYSWLKSLFHI